VIEEERDGPYERIKVEHGEVSICARKTPTAVDGLVTYEGHRLCWLSYVEYRVDEEWRCGKKVCHGGRSRKERSSGEVIYLIRGKTGLMVMETATVNVA
jgi:hypothetical protein